MLMPHPDSRRRAFALALEIPGNSGTGLPGGLVAARLVRICEAPNSRHGWVGGAHRGLKRDSEAA